MKPRQALASVAVLFVVLPLAVRADPVPEPRQAQDPTGPHAPIAGRASCSGRACHGGVEGRPGSEGAYTVWLRSDPHAHAYDALLGRRGQQIARLLGGERAHESERCLACHATPGADSSLVAEGVGCEACHGAANGKDPWLQAHTRRSWRKADADVCGMRALSEATVQAKVCAGCHVGAAPGGGLPARDVDHDLLAAGHPRLAFEFTVYRDNLPPHWATREPERDDAWAVGRLLAADAYLELLAYRADRKGGPWPEFSEYDCFACHADLRADSWRATRAYLRDRRPGSWPPNVWYLTGLLAVGVPRKELAELGRALAVPLPKRTAVAGKATALRASLKGLLDPAARPERRRILAGLVPGDTRPEALTWDEAMQLTLAVEALTNPGDVPRLRAQRLRPLLAFPPQFESPGTFRRDRRLDEALAELLSSLKR